MIHEQVTLKEAMKKLKNEGYEVDINVVDENTADAKGRKLSPDQLKIDAHKRFEGDTDPSDMSALYAVSENGKKLGLIVDNYDPKEETKSNVFVRKIESESKL